MTQTEASSAAAIYEKEGSIAYFRINRPKRSNSLDGEALTVLDHALSDAAADDNIRVLLFEGLGKGFCSGYDLAPTGAINIKTQTVTEDWARLQRNNDRWERIFSFPKPTVAKVHGFALAGGFELAMSCDLVIATEDARIGHPPLRSLGVPPFLVFPQVLGHRAAREMLLTGNSVSGKDAHRRGWITRAVPAEKLEEATAQVLRSLCSMSLENLRLIKTSLLRADMITGYRAVRAMGVEFDAVAHRAPSAERFWNNVDEFGLTAALRERDAPFEEWSYGTEDE